MSINEQAQERRGVSMVALSEVGEDLVRSLSVILWELRRADEGRAQNLTAQISALAKESR